MQREPRLQPAKLPNPEIVLISAETTPEEYGFRARFIVRRAGVRYGLGLIVYPEVFDLGIFPPGWIRSQVEAVAVNSVIPGCAEVAAKINEWISALPGGLP